MSEQKVRGAGGRREVQREEKVPTRWAQLTKQVEVDVAALLLKPKDVERQKKLAQSLGQLKGFLQAEIKRWAGSYSLEKIMELDGMISEFEARLSMPREAVKDVWSKAAPMFDLEKEKDALTNAMMEILFKLGERSERTEDERVPRGFTELYKKNLADAKKRSYANRAAGYTPLAGGMLYTAVLCETVGEYLRSHMTEEGWKQMGQAERKLFVGLLALSKANEYAFYFATGEKFEEFFRQVGMLLGGVFSRKSLGRAWEGVRKFFTPMSEKELEKFMTKDLYYPGYRLPPPSREVSRAPAYLTGGEGAAKAWEGVKEVAKALTCVGPLADSVMSYGRMGELIRGDDYKAVIAEIDLFSGAADNFAMFLVLDVLVLGSSATAKAGAKALSAKVAAYAPKARAAVPKVIEAMEAFYKTPKGLGILERLGVKGVGTRELLTDRRFLTEFIDAGGMAGLDDKTARLILKKFELAPAGAH